MCILFENWYPISFFMNVFGGKAKSHSPEGHSPIQKVMMTFATVTCLFGVSWPNGWTKT